MHRPIVPLGVDGGAVLQAWSPWGLSVGKLRHRAPRLGGEGVLPHSGARTPE